MIDLGEALKPTTDYWIPDTGVYKIFGTQISSNITITDMYLFSIWEYRCTKSYWWPIIRQVLNFVYVSAQLEATHEHHLPDFGPRGLGDALHWPRVHPIICLHTRISSLICHPFSFIHSSLIFDNSVLRDSPFISL